MKPKIHPEYVDATITCACGNQVKTRSTKKEIKVDVCSACHPFYTGKQKLVDSAGRVERYMRKYGLERGAEAKKDEEKDEETGTEGEGEADA
ncbi:MAG TPA: 50S ribosomal protein L31 [bacterium]|nr:50S ribosomal protein L31 [bacterium]